MTMPVVVPREAFERLQKWKDKDKGVNYNHRPPQEFESRYLFLRYKKNGGHRVKRLTVKNRISGAGVRGKVVVKFKMISPEKNEQKEAIALELGPGQLEPLLTKALLDLGADSGDLVYYWEVME